MKLVGIGDLFIPGKYIKEGFQDFKNKNIEIETIEWELDGSDELQEINQLIEKNGSEYYQIPDYILEATKDADILITQFCPVTKELIDNCNKLKMIGVLRGGYENINIDYANENGILILNTPGRNSDAVADFTVGMIISECRNIAKSHKELKRGNWKRKYSNESYVPDFPGKVLGIIGLGEIGMKVAKRMKGFDVEIIAYDPFVEVPDYGIRMTSLEEVMSKSDFVSVHARVTEDTKNMINKDLLNKMKSTSYFINTARPDLVDEEALYEILKNKQIAGAALDVFDKEPPGKDYPIVNLENVTITPHLAGGTKDAFLNSPKKLAKEMIKILDNKKPAYMLNDKMFNQINKLF